jgi:hypothetical protein
MQLTIEQISSIRDALVRPICRKLCGAHRDFDVIECDILSTLWIRSINLKHERNLKGWVVKTIYQEVKKRLSVIQRRSMSQVDERTWEQVAADSAKSVLDSLCQHEILTRASHHLAELDNVRITGRARGLSESKVRQLIRNHKNQISYALES